METHRDFWQQSAEVGKEQAGPFLLPVITGHEKMAKEEWRETSLRQS